MVTTDVYPRQSVVHIIYLPYVDIWLTGGGDVIPVHWFCLTTQDNSLAIALVYSFYFASNNCK
jgi:hypothetical protein